GENHQPYSDAPPHRPWFRPRRLLGGGSCFPAMLHEHPNVVHRDRKCGSQQQYSRDDQQIFQCKHDHSFDCCDFFCPVICPALCWCATNRRTRPPNTSSSTSTPHDTLSSRAPTTLRISAKSSMAVLAPPLTGQPEKPEPQARLLE